MPLSSAPVAGADITAVGIGNMRKDAIIRTEVVVAGEAITTSKTDGAVTFPTVVYKSGTKWYLARSDAPSGNQGAGYVQDVAIAMTPAAGDNSTFTIVKPGSQITTELFPFIAGLTAGQTYFPSATVPGGISTFNQAAMKAYRVIGCADTTTSFDFTPTHNSTLLQNPLGLLNSASAISIGDLLWFDTSARMWVTNATSPFGSGYAKSMGVAYNSASGANEPILFFKPGAICPINGGPFTPGKPVFVSDTPGQVSHARGRFTRQVGTAVSTTQIYFFPLEPEDHMIIEIVQADDPWTVGDFLYRKSSNGHAARSDCDLIEPGIAEVPYIALTTHASVGSWQPVILPGSVCHSLFSGTAGTKLWNSATIGGRSTTFPGHDLYTRMYGYFIELDRFYFFPEASRFMPPGEQEKGFCGAGTRNDTSDADVAADRNTVSFGFNKVMVNLPASITLTLTDSFGSPSVSVLEITRYGFRLQVDASGSGIFRWSGYYTTVGN